MYRIRIVFCVLSVLSLLVCGCAGNSWAQSQTRPASVPPLVKFNGTAKDASGQPLHGLLGATFSLYKDEQGGAPLWLETQNILADSNGQYVVELGAGKSQGLPAELFTSGDARWLGVSINGNPELPRVFLLSVPYALKAADAETVGGLPASAFMLAAPASAGATGGTSISSLSASQATGPNIGGSGTQNYLPLWIDNNGDLGNSVFYQVGTGSTAKLGLNLKNPLATLDVNGTTLIRGTLEPITKGVANASKGYNSNPLDLEASAFNSSTQKAVMQHFEWQAEPTGNNTNNPAATLNLLFGTDNNTPAETGLKLSNTGIFSFVSGQTFPGTGTITGITTASGSGLTGGGTSGNLNLSLTNTCTANQVLQWSGSAWVCAGISGGGTITGVTAGTDLTGGGTSGNVTLNLDTTKVPQLATSNTFTADQKITGNLSVSGNVSAGLSVTGLTANFTGSNASLIAQVTQNGLGTGLNVQQNNAGTGTSPAIFGTSAGQNTTVIQAQSTNVNGNNIAIYGTVSSPSGIGVFGQAANTAGGLGIFGQTTASSNGVAVEGIATGKSSLAGVFDNQAGGQILSLRNNGVEKVAIDGFGDLDLNGGQLIVESGPVPAVLNATSGGTILIGQSKGTQKFSVDGSGNLSASGSVTASSFTGSGSGLAGVALLGSNNTFSGSQTIQGNLAVGNSSSSNSLQTFGKDASGVGIQNDTVNTSTAGNSFAVIAATSSVGVTAEMVADGLGTGPMGTPGGYLGTFTNHPLGFIAGDSERMLITASGSVGIGTSNPQATLETDAPANSDEVAISARGGSTNTNIDGAHGIETTGGLNNYAQGQGGFGILATGGFATGAQSSGGEGISATGGESLGWIGGDGGSFSGGEAPNGAGGDGILAIAGSGAGSGWGAYIIGNLNVSGTIYAGTKDFKIDHPLDPANKYLYHASVESSEMMNIYTGNVTTDRGGIAIVELPNWFQALNTDFRYQLTVIGQFAQAIVAREISDNHFQIKTDKPNVKVSWQVTCVRQDAYAVAHPLSVEVDKPERERGFYIYPELYGAAEEKAVIWAHRPQLMKRMHLERQKIQGRTNSGAQHPQNE